MLTTVVCFCAGFFLLGYSLGVRHESARCESDVAWWKEYSRSLNRAVQVWVTTAYRWECRARELAAELEEIRRRDPADWWKEQGE